MPSAPSQSLRDADALRKRKERKTLKTILIPACADPARRKSLEADDNAWLRWYFHDQFWYDFTPQQRAMIDAIRTAIIYGGDQAIAASRGEGKTKLCEAMLLKYTLTGVIRFSVLFAATGPLAENSLAAMRYEIERNDRLADDYPEACVPVRALEDTPNRAHYQLVSGKRHDTGEPFEGVSSKFTWCGQEVIFPDVPGSPSAQGIIATRGLDAAVRGLNKRKRRPDVAVIDDPDTKETVNSDEQAQKLESKIDADIAGLGGQQRPVARVMITTLQSNRCVSAKYTDPAEKPSFSGKRYRFLVKKPDREDMWAEYVQRWRLGFMAGDKHARAAFAYYAENRAAMDAGAEVANPNRFDATILPDGSPKELSSLQRYYNEVGRTSQAAVSTEYDNDPPADTMTTGLATAGEIAAKVHGYGRGVVPSDAAYLTAMVDVQGSLLYWIVAAWRPDFTGYVIDYGAWPEQKRIYYRLSEASPVFADLCGGGFEAQCHHALTSIVGNLLGRDWQVDGGNTMKIGKMLIDANYGASTDTVYNFIAQHPMRALLLPSHGRGIKASQAPMHLWPAKQGERAGVGWRVRPGTVKRAPIPHAIIDTNHWKSFVHTRILVPIGGKGSLSLFQAEPAIHQMFADHLLAEGRKSITDNASKRTIDEWQEKANHPDNHFLDLIVGAAAAASMLGASLEHHEGKIVKQARTLSQMRKDSR